MRIYITIFIGLLLIAASYFVAKDLANTKKRQRPKNEKVKPTVFTEIVKNANVPVNVLESGRLLAKNRIEVFSEVQGVMVPTKKEFKPGAYYKKVKQ